MGRGLREGFRGSRLAACCVLLLGASGAAHVPEQGLAAAHDDPQVSASDFHAKPEPIKHLEEKLAGCPLTKPVVILKVGESGSSAVVQGLKEMLAPCLIYGEILNMPVNNFECTASLVRQHEERFKTALSQNAIISHDPHSSAGGCLSTMDSKGPERLTKLLQGSGATVVAWTRTNALRHEAGHPGQGARLAKRGKATITKFKGEEFYNATKVVENTMRHACGMLEVKKAMQLSTGQKHWHQHLTYEEFGHSPMGTMAKLMSWVQLKPAFNATGLLNAYTGYLREPHVEDKKATVSMASYFNNPKEVIGNLSAVCLDWMYYGGAYTNMVRPKNMCLSASTCAKAGFECTCAEKKHKQASFLEDRELSAAAVSYNAWWPDETDASLYTNSGAGSASADGDERRSERQRQRRVARKGERRDTKLGWVRDDEEE